MAEKLGEALLDLDTNDKGFKRGIDRAEKDARGLGAVLDNVSGRALAMGRNLAIGAAAGTAAMAVLIKRAIDGADAMSKSAQKAGMTTEALSRLAWAGELSDVSLESMTASMGRLSNLMAQMASGGAKDTKAIFDNLGIAVTDSDGRLRSVSDVLTELADRFAGMDNGATKSALAIQIFGRSGAELIPLLNSGKSGLADMADEADRLGKTISTSTGQDAEQFNDTLTRLGAIVDGVGLKVATGILPQLNELGAKLADPAFVSAAQGMAQGIVGAINMIIDAVAAAGSKLSELGNLMEWMRVHDWSSGQINQDALDAAKRGAAAEAGGQINRGDMEAPSAAFLSSIFGTATQPAATAPSAPGINMGSLFGGGAAAEADKVKELIKSLEAERDTLREMDPVQQRLISLREQLAKATPAQETAVRNLISTIYEETKAWDNAQAASQAFGDQMISSLEGLRQGTKSLTDVLDDMKNALAQAVLQSMLLGQGPLSGVFGTQNAKGGVGGLMGGLGSLFSGFFAKGGLIPSGSFGIVGENGPEPVWGASGGTQVMSNPDFMGMLSGGGRGPVTVHINGSGLTQAELTQAVADGIDRYDRHQLPQRVNEIQRDPLARG